MEKILVIGANHAGTHAILKLCENNKNKDKEIIVYDRNDNISFLGCGMALWMSNVIDNSDCLFYANEEVLKDLGCSVNLNSDVVKIDYDKKEVEVVNLLTGETIIDTYDKIILGFGSWPIVPNIKGVDLENVEIVKIFQHAEKIINKMEDNSINKVAVIGAGYIGVEIAEALIKNGKEVVLVNDKGVLSSYYDENYQIAMQKELESIGVNVIVDSFVNEITGDTKVEGILVGDKNIDVDMVILATGFAPLTSKFKSDKLKLHESGAILVNDKMESSIKDVYAIGDCAAIYNSASKTNMYIALASNALKTGTVAGLNAMGIESHMPSIQGSNAICIGDLVLASTGIKQCNASQYGIEARSVTLTDCMKPAFMPKNFDVTLTLTYEVSTKRVIGFQIMSNFDVSLLIHMFSLAISKECTIDELYLMDTFFLPHFNQPHNIIMKIAEMAIKDSNK